MSYLQRFEDVNYSSEIKVHSFRNQSHVPRKRKSEVEVVFGPGTEDKRCGRISTLGSTLWYSDIVNTWLEGAIQSWKKINKRHQLQIWVFHQWAYSKIRVWWRVRPEVYVVLVALLFLVQSQLSWHIGFIEANCHFGGGSEEWFQSAHG